MWYRAVFAAVVLTVLSGCAGTPERGDAVLQFVDIRNESGEPVLVTARVSTSPEQQLGFLGPGEFRRFEIPTGANTTGDLFLRARNPQTGREAVETLQVVPGQTLEWRIRFS